MAMAPGSRRGRAVEAIAAGLALMLFGGIGIAVRFRFPAPSGLSGPSTKPVAAAVLRADAERAAEHLFRRPVLALYVEKGRPPRRLKGTGNGYELNPGNVLMLLGSGGRAYVAALEMMMPAVAGSPVQPSGWFVYGTSAAGVRRTTVSALPPGERSLVQGWARKAGIAAATIAVWPFPDDAVVAGGEQGRVEAIRILSGPGGPTVQPLFGQGSS